MKPKLFLLMLCPSVLLSSCASQSGDEYDVSNPYSAPDYGSEVGTPSQADSLPSEVNPAYDAPAVYEDTKRTPEPTPTKRPIRATAQEKVHTVVSGDSLWKISKTYGVSIASIKQANHMTKDTVVLGAKLKIPAK